MSVAVYSRLGDLLKIRGLSVEELQSRIAARFGLAVDAGALGYLMRDNPVRGLDMEAAGAAAAALDIDLGEVFVVDVVPATDGGTEHVDNSAGDGAGEDDVLDPEQARRLRQLYTIQGRRALTDDEWAEMDALVAEYGRRAYERGVRAIAERDGLPVERVMADLAAERDRAAAWYQELEADPTRRAALVREAVERQRARAIS